MGLFNDKQISQTPGGVGQQGPPGPQGVGFKMTSHGNYDMDNKILFNVKTQDDVPDDSDSIKKDYGSAVNKEYLKNNFLKRDSKTQTFFDLKGYSIQNSEVYDPNSWNDKTITNKEYVDLRDNLKADKTELAKKADLETSDEQTFKGIINVPDFDSGYSNMSNVMNKEYIDSRDALKADKSYADNTFLTKNTGAILANTLQSKASKIYADSTFLTRTQGNVLSNSLHTKLDINGSNSMQSNLKMGGYKITGIGSPTDDQDCVTKKYMLDNTAQIHVSPIGQENVFDKVMTDHTYQLSEENDIELGALVTYNDSLHKINKKAIDMQLILDSQKKFYSSRLGINMYNYDIDFYTMIIEIFFPSEIDKNTVDISVVAVYETINKVTTRVNNDHCRTLVQVHKTQQHGNNYLYADIVMKMKSKHPYIPKLQCYLIIYGIRSYQSNVDTAIYDALWYIDNNEKLAFNTPITLQNQSISGVKDAKNDDDGVNYKQLNTLEATLLGKLGALQPKSYYNTIFEYFFDLLDPSEFTMSDSFGAVLSGLGSNLVFQTTKLLKEFKPRDGFTGVFIVNLNENVIGSDDWTMYIAFKFDYKPGDNKRIKIELGNDGSFDFPWVKLESGKLFLDYALASGARSKAR